MKLNASLMKISRSQDDDVCAAGHTVEAQFENTDGIRQGGAQRFICRLRRNPSSFSPPNEIQTDFHSRSTLAGSRSSGLVYCSLK